MAKVADVEARIRVLEDIEAIKRLKSKYWRSLDKKLWDELVECFTERAIIDYGPTRRSEGRSDIIRDFKASP